MKGWVLSLMGLGLAGCVSTKDLRYETANFYSKAPARVAVLAFDNQSLDLTGPELLRKMVASSLNSRGYETVPLEKVDEKLKTLGITDGGQLRAVTPQQVGAAMEADGLLYGDVEDFAFLNIGFAIRRIVRLHLKLVLALSGEKLWEDTGQGLSQFLILQEKEAQRAFIEGLALREKEILFHIPLLPEAQEAVQVLLGSLPPRGAQAAPK